MNEKIIPAIMPQNFDDIESYASMVRYQVTTVQLDLMDGKYVPEKTWPFYYGTDYDLEALKKQDSSLPFWEDVDYELDLMVRRPEESLETWLGIGASRIIFHYASIHDWEKIRTIDVGIRNFIHIGLAVTVHDDLEKICTLIDEGLFDFVQIMGIAQIGYMGEPFEESSLDIIEQLRTKYPDMTLSVDGGVSLDTIADLQDAGIDRFVSGSGVYGNGTVEDNIQNLQSQLL